MSIWNFILFFFVHGCGIQLLTKWRFFCSKKFIQYNDIAPIYLFYSNWSFILHFWFWYSFFFFLRSFRLFTKFIIGLATSYFFFLMNARRCMFDEYSLQIGCLWAFGGQRHIKLAANIDKYCRKQNFFFVHFSFLNFIKAFIRIFIFHIDLICNVLIQPIQGDYNDYCQITRFLLHFIGNYCCNCQYNQWMKKKNYYFIETDD